LQPLLLTLAGYRSPEMADGKIHSVAAFNASPSYRACIDDRPKFIWNFLKPAFDWGIAPTDVDGLVERNGNYLLFECKYPGADIPTGQKRMLKDLNERHGFTIFVVTGFTQANISGLFVSWPRGAKKEPYKNIDSNFLLDKTRQWFDWADQRGPPATASKTPQEQTMDEWLRDYDKGFTEKAHGLVCSR